MSRRILVADDSSTIQKVVKIAFSQYPVAISETGSYVEALQEIRRNKADVLILDACLPGADGPEDFVKLARECGGVPVLLLVGSYQNVDEDSFRRAGLDGFLKKPFDSGEIVERVERLLGPLDADGGDYSDDQDDEPEPPPLKQAQQVPQFEPDHYALSNDDDDYGDVPVVGEGFALPLTEAGRKGRPAFEESGGRTASGRPSSTTTVIIPPPPPQATNPAGRPAEAFHATSRSDLEDTKVRQPLPAIPPSIGEFGASQPTQPRATVAPDDQDVFPANRQLLADLEDMLPALVREAVENYCDRHFKSLAREVISAELRRLADEKARHLVDH